MLEYGFPCSDIIVGDSAYGNELAIRFYDGAVSNAGLRLTMTAKPDGDWYIWVNAVERPHE